MSAVTGRSYGPYEVIAPIGAGGMGEVFKARDTRLGRLVALKTSREQFSDRFAGEARATAALNHPHIATLYDVGPDYLVLEFVEGETLRGPLPMVRALLYAGQILDALEAAHRKGITHRDLKPANIMVSKSGVKLLDFGLAQMKPGGPLGDLSADQTATMALSKQGTIAGTLQYMAPEQLQGKPADARSDIFAFGLVLYEMLTGRRAFDGADSASVISAIMTGDPPPLPDSQSAAPAGLRRILKQCLAKDPDERWQNAADIRRALELVEAAPGISQPAAAATRFRWAWAAAAFAAGALIVFAALRLSSPKAADAWTFRPLTYSGRAIKPSVSPDGKQVAFIWSGEKDKEFDLYVQLVSGGNPLRLPDAHPSGKCAWSPDGSRLAFLRQDGVYVMPTLGGTPRRISSFADGGNISDVAWSPDGTFLIFGGPGPGLSEVSAEGGELRELTKPAFAHDYSPSISPDGRTVAFVRRNSTYNSGVLMLPLKRDGAAAGPAKQITTSVWDIGTLDWTADGREILFEGSAGSGNPSLWRISYSGGKPVRFNAPSVISVGPAVARQSGRMVYVSVEYEAKIFKMPLGGRAGEPQPLVEALGDHRDLGVSPDGSRIAFTSNRTGSKEIWTANADGTNQTQLTSFNGPSVGSPHWSPDGKQIVFDGYASGSSDIYLISAEGGKPLHLTNDPGNEVRPSWSHDGQWIYFGWNRAGREKNIWKIRPSGGNPVQVTRNGGNDALETPDGQWLYVDDPPKLSRMRPDGSEETPVGNGVYSNFWTIAGRNVYVLNPDSGSLFRAPFGGTGFEAFYQFNGTNQPEGGGACIGLPRDESYIIYRRNTRSSATLMLIEGFH